MTEEIAISKKKTNCWGGNNQAQKDEVVAAVEKWREKKKRHVFPLGNQYAAGQKNTELYKDEEKLEIVRLVAQTMIIDNLSTIDAIDKLIQDNIVPWEKKGSAKWVINYWCGKNPELKEILRAAREERAYSMVEEIEALDIEIAEKIKKVNPKIANAVATLHKTRSTNRQWLAERIYPKEFSPKLQVAGEIKHTMVSLQIIAPAGELVKKNG